MGVKRKTVLRRSGEADGELLHYRESGLDNVYLANGWRWEETPIGRFLEIKDDRALFVALARHIIEQPHLPRGKQLRYLRVYLDLNQAELGQLLGLSDQQVARWEKETSRIEPAVLRLFSLLVRERIGEKVAVEADLKAAADNVKTVRKQRPVKVVAFRRSGWKTKEAA
jgi:DNA-binding transcriptional regulator YiaG